MTKPPAIGSIIIINGCQKRELIDREAYHQNYLRIIGKPSPDGLDGIPFFIRYVEAPGHVMPLTTLDPYELYACPRHAGPFIFNPKDA